MHTTYQLHSSELDEKFLETIKQRFVGKNIKIVITELDDTSYLSASAANHDHLMKVIKEIDAGENLKAVDLEEYS